ncbi:TSSK6-activating co-chaperone protein isoform X5 [Rhineura floridana]|uniref:TSSK6-activating co-chaperone protein isoform X5 n=1 Tax=Rhineura floridana TaxID=261503 RepID=UPI002AC82682|nr:TSSK6-activating co-chaperone protein isoform X5 [Rhineura floridana]
MMGAVVRSLPVGITTRFEPQQKIKTSPKELQRSVQISSMKPERHRKTFLTLNKKHKPLPPVHMKGTSSSPVRMEPEVNPQDEKQHRKNTPRRSSHVPPPEHQPQECFGLLECMHNNIQTQTQIAQAQLSLLEGMQESMNILLSRQEKQNQELMGLSDQRTPKGSASSPRPTS